MNFTKIETFYNQNILVWIKKALKGFIRTICPSYEFIIFAVKEQGRKLNGKREKRFIKFIKSKAQYHPTEKPVDLLEYLILNTRVIQF